jgi:hypothetical protein
MKQPSDRTPPAGPPVLMTGKLHGLRTWRLVIDGHGAIRLGCFGDRSWRPNGETTWAECVPVRYLVRRRHRVASPAAGCECGLYALHPWATRRSAMWCRTVPGDYFAVAGIIEAWGRVQVHDEGFRAQYARPTALLLIGIAGESDYGRLVASVARTHLAELIEVASLEDLVGYCRDKGLGLSQQTVTSLLQPVADAGA